jgi:hypothetical protein
MKNEIDKDFYCVTGFQRKSGSFMESECYGAENRTCCECCTFSHRKYPTPEQYRKEYGEEYPDDAAVYLYRQYKGWRIEPYDYAKQFLLPSSNKDPFYIVIACTPFGAPPDDWRPE